MRKRDQGLLSEIERGGHAYRIWTDYRGLPFRAGSIEACRPMLPAWRRPASRQPSKQEVQSRTQGAHLHTMGGEGMGWLQWQDWEKQQRRRRHQGRDSKEPQHKSLNPIEDENRKRRQRPVKGKKAWGPHLRDGLKSTRKRNRRTPRDLFGGVRSIVQGGAPGMGKKHGKRR